MTIFLDASKSQESIQIGAHYLSIIGIAYVIAGIMHHRHLYRNSDLLGLRLYHTCDAILFWEVEDEEVRLGLFQIPISISILLCYNVTSSSLMTKRDNKGDGFLMQSRTIQYFSLFLGVLALSTSAIFVKLADAPSSITAFYRLFFAALVLLPFLLFKKENRQALLSLSLKQLGLGLLSGLFLAIHYVLWFESLNYTSVASSTVIVTLQPLFSFVLGHFLFKERFSKKAIASCLVSLIGCFIIGQRDFEISYQALFGDVLAFLAAGVITAYFMIGQYMRKKLSVIPYSILGYLSSAFFLAVYALSQRVSFTDYPINTWKSLIGIALIATILGQMVFNWLLKWLNASVISMSILGETVGTCVLAYFILDEVISFQQGIGILIILVGLASFLFYQNKDKSNH